MTDLLSEAVELIDLPPFEEQTPAEEVVALLDRVVARFGPDHKYHAAGEDSCRYVDVIDGASGLVVELDYDNVDLKPHQNWKAAPSCIVGHLIHEKVGPESLDYLMTVNTEVVTHFIDDYGDLPLRWRLDETLIDALRLLQIRQDDGWPWGSAVAIFKADVGLVAA